jgi:2-iminoacetate synthase ThiH
MTTEQKTKRTHDKITQTAPDLLAAARCALADLEGIMPDFEPSGDREHPGWQTIKELRKAIAKATGEPVMAA